MCIEYHMETKSYETCRMDNSEPEQIKTAKCLFSLCIHQHSKTCTQNIHCIYCNIYVAQAYIASTADVTPALTIIIPDGDDCFIKVWVHYNSWLATRVSKGDLELFVSLHNELIYHPNYKLDSSLTSRDGHLSGESGSREINTSCGGEWKQEIPNQACVMSLLTTWGRGVDHCTCVQHTRESNYIMHYIMDKTRGLIVSSNIVIQHAQLACQTHSNHFHYLVLWKDLDLLQGESRYEDFKYHPYSNFSKYRE